MLEIYKNNLDSFGLITKALDGGDTCSRHCTLFYCLPPKELELHAVLKQLNIAGIPIRHPDQTKWYCTTDRTSRDQLLPYLCLVATPNKADYYYCRELFLQLVAQHAKRGFLFAWNTKRNWVYSTLEEHVAKSTADVPWNYSNKIPDLCFMNVWAIYLRGLMHYTVLGKLLSPVIYGVLHILDMQGLLDSIMIRTQQALGYRVGSTRVAKSIDHDMQNSTLYKHYASVNYPTVVSRLAWNLHKEIGILAAESFFQQPEEPRLDYAIKHLD